MKNSSHIYFKGGFKYRVERDFFYNLKPGLVSEVIREKYFTLYPSGLVHIKPGWAWDGCSGPTIDDKTSMRASAIHDLGYYLIRQGIIDRKEKKYFDKEFRVILKLDGMPFLRRNMYYQGVKYFGKKSTLAQSIKQVKKAP